MMLIGKKQKPKPQPLTIRSADSITRDNGSYWPWFLFGLVGAIVCHSLVSDAVEQGVYNGVTRSTSEFVTSYADEIDRLHEAA